MIYKTIKIHQWGNLQMIKEKRLGLDEDIKLFADELKKCFSKDED